MSNETKYADPEKAARALTMLAANVATIKSWHLSARQLTDIAATFATPYISADGVEAARAYYARIGEQAIDEAYDALAWQMVGPSGSDAQRELSHMLDWAPGWAEERNEQLRENYRKRLRHEREA